MANWEKIKEPKNKPAGKPYRESENAIGPIPIDKSRQLCKTWVSISVEPKGAGKDVWESCSKCEYEDGKVVEHVHRPKDSDGVYDEDGNKVGFAAQFDKTSGEQTRPWHVGNSERGTHEGKFYKKCIQIKTSIRRCVNEHKNTGAVTWTEEGPAEWSKLVNTYKFGPSVIWEGEQTRSCDEKSEPLVMLTDDSVATLRPNLRKSKA